MTTVTSPRLSGKRLLGFTALPAALMLLSLPFIVRNGRLARPKEYA
ncbi:hypothetical protein [Nonomuraea sp. LPB2021202275-12-8]